MKVISHSKHIASITTFSIVIVIVIASLLIDWRVI